MKDFHDVRLFTYLCIKQVCITYTTLQGVHILNKHYTLLVCGVYCSNGTPEVNT